ncbi:D-alanyl-D-alanine carboxypeptidase [Patescibacteria group bacterium]|nr:D-alanyl-D-alanine carboxypeptidase [Patescibacteria group bacterium]
MKTIAILLVMLNYLTGSSALVKDSLWGILTDPQTYSLHALASQFLKPEPVRDVFYPNPEIKASAVVVTDLDTGKVLFAKSADTQLAMASITKIMTSVVVLNSKTNLNEIYMVPEEATKVTGSQIYLLANEKMTIQNLLQSALIGSANDAAYALAYNTAGSEEKFVELMNNYAKFLGLENTHFTNAWGADDPNHYSCARDLAKLTGIALQNETFRNIVATEKTVITDVTGKLKHSLENTNKLIGKYVNIIGVKTGTTDGAGESLVVAAKGESNQTVVAVLLNSPDRFTEGKILLDWALKAYNWIEPL